MSLVTALYYGDRRRFEELGQAIKHRAATTREVHHVGEAMTADAQMAFLDGRLEECVDIWERWVNYRNEAYPTGLSIGLAALAMWALKPFFYLGGPVARPRSVLWPALEEGWNIPQHRRIPILQAYAGQTAEANQKLDRMLEARPDVTSTEDLTQAWLDVTYLESAILTEHRRAVELIFQRFARNTLTLNPYTPTSIARQLGAAAAMLGKYDEAREHYQEAIKACTEMRFRPELALTSLGLAELLLDHFPAEKKEAIGHLDFAIREFREMKMQPSLERALRRKEILKA
jgi:tetratricopeptide (TPR) repeat protein